MKSTMPTTDAAELAMTAILQYRGWLCNFNKKETGFYLEGTKYKLDLNKALGQCKSLQWYNSIVKIAKRLSDYESTYYGKEWYDKNRENYIDIPCKVIKKNNKLLGSRLKRICKFNSLNINYYYRYLNGSLREIKINSKENVLRRMAAILLNGYLPYSFNSKGEILYC